MSSEVTPPRSYCSVEAEKQEDIEQTILESSAVAPLSSPNKEDTTDQEKNVSDQPPQGGTKPAGRGLPPNHPMHPSQFSGDRFGWINCIGVFLDYYQTHQLKNLSASTVSWIVSLELFFMFIGGPIVGKVFDNFGPRYLLLVGTTLHVLGLMMASISTEYYQFILSQGVCSPIGAGMLFFPAMTSTISWFLKKRALAFGVIASGASLGGVVFPILVARLVTQLGFAWTMRICAFVILGLLIIGNLTITCRIRPVKKPLSVYEFVAPLQERSFALLAAGSFIGYIGLFIPFSYIVLQASSIGMSTELQGYLIPILNAASLFGRTIPGHVADNIGRFNVMIIMVIFSVVCVFAVWIPAQTNATVIVFAILYGFGSGAFISLMPTLVAEVTKDLSKLGVRNGTMFAVISVGTLIGSPIAGALIAACEGKFWGLEIFTGVTLAISAVIIAFTRASLVGWKLKAKI
ncbi:monocarboxylate transporter [Xylariales sp. PMI_506]|nr:monocarboxylate transporter [Xylariales sp. PMI_506]